MMSEALALQEPWGWLIAKGRPLHDITSLDGWGTPRLLFPLVERFVNSYEVIVAYVGIAF
jgi:hypothetical protein